MTRARVTIAIFVFLLLFASLPLSATTFIVPDDAELVAKSEAIVKGVVLRASLDESDPDYLRTVYELRLDRVLKGPISGDTLTIASPGGANASRRLLVHGAAHFEAGDEVVLFLVRHRGYWTPTDLTLGKFRFALSSGGRSLLVRDDEDIVGWDRSGNVHEERVRAEEEFLSFIEKKAKGVAASTDYFLDAVDVVPPQRVWTPQAEAQIGANLVPAPSHTYSISFLSTSGCAFSRIPGRWTTARMSSGVAFYKNAAQNATSTADGGVALIQSGLNAWNNDCGSTVNIPYGGTHANLKNSGDGVNVIVYNDPGSHVAGTWNGSGVIATTFSAGGGSHTFDSVSWISLSDTDIVFQNGYPGNHGAMATAMTHEIGHAIGLRHADKHFVPNCTLSEACSLSCGADSSCDPNVADCASTAIMTAMANSGLGFSLQAWDQNAARGLYPGGTCTPACTAPSITQQPGNATITAGGSSTLSVLAGGTAPLTYQWYTGTAGNAASPIAGATASSRQVSPSATTSYWVRVSNACGTVNSSTATVTVNPLPPPARRTDGDLDGDGKADIIVWRPSTGYWFYYRTTLGGSATLWGVNGDVPKLGDFDGDGRDEVAVWRPSTGMWYGSFGGIHWGQNGDIPLVGDFDGNGRDDVAVWRPSTGYWYTHVGVGTMRWGENGDVPLVGDFNGDGRDEPAVWRPSTGMWYTTTGFGSMHWGQAGDVPLIGDFNGDGRDEPAVWRPSNGMWYTTAGFGSMRWGQSGDVPAAADYDGDGDTDVAVWRPSTGMWYTTAGIGVINWGVSTDVVPAIR